jgi:hypothetical protein
MKMVNPESELMSKIGDQNPILGLIVQKLAPQLKQLGVSGSDQAPESFNKGL